MLKIIKKINRWMGYKYIRTDRENIIKVTLASDGKIRLKNIDKSLCDELYKQIKNQPIPNVTLRGDYRPGYNGVTITSQNKKERMKIYIPNAVGDKTRKSKILDGSRPSSLECNGNTDE